MLSKRARLRALGAIVLVAAGCQLFTGTGDLTYDREAAPACYDCYAAAVLLAGTTDPAKVDFCGGETGTDARLYTELADCANASCGASTKGGLCFGATFPFDEACRNCLFTSCAVQEYACFNETACVPCALAAAANPYATDKVHYCDGSKALLDKVVSSCECADCFLACVSPVGSCPSGNPQISGTCLGCLQVKPCAAACAADDQPPPPEPR